MKVKEIKKTNPRILNIVRKFEEKGRKEKRDIFRRIAEIVSKPRKLKAEINLYQIDKICGEKDVIAIPGKVLGTGKIKKNIKIYAMEYSGSAKKKLKEEKVEFYEIEKLLEDNPKGIRLVI